MAKTHSHWSIDLAVLTAIRQLVPQGSTIVELGSGSGTINLVKEYTVYSIEDDEKWLGYCEDSNYIHAPLVELDNVESFARTVRWYDPEILKHSLPEKYDLLLVDGPSGEKGRDGLLANMELFNTDIPIVIDDTLREHECRVAREIAYLLNRPLYLFWNFSIIVPKPLEGEIIAKIHKRALQMLEKEPDQYLKRYFRRIEPLMPINIDFWKDAQLEASYYRRRVNLMESSLSWRIGRIMTLPLWPIYKMKSALLKRKNKK